MFVLNISNNDFGIQVISVRLLGFRQKLHQLVVQTFCLQGDDEDEDAGLCLTPVWDKYELFWT